MPIRIDRLTDEQKAAMGPYAQAAISRALDCTPVDRASVEDGIRRCYGYAGLRWHGNVVWVDSPVVVAIAGPVAAHVLRSDEAVDRAIDRAIRGAVDRAVDAAVDRAVDAAVDRAVDAAVDRAVDAAVDRAVDAAVATAVGVAVDGALRAVDGPVAEVVGDAVTDAVRRAVDGAARLAVANAVDGVVYRAVDVAVGGAVGGVDVAVGRAVHGAVRRALAGAAANAVYDGWWRYLGGQWWAGWPTWRSYFRDVCHLDIPGDAWDRLAASEAASQAGWWWPHTDFVVISERPAEIHRERAGPDGWGSHRLHCSTGPSIRFRDGWALWHWHGQQVPQWAIESPDPSDNIARVANTEIRRAAIERWGWDRYLDAIGAHPVDTQPDPGNPGHHLHLYDLPRDHQVYDSPVRLLVMDNASRDRDGTRRRYAETVPVDVPDAVSAAAWQFGVDTGTYARLERAT